MKRIPFLILFISRSLPSLFGQTKTITGTVISSIDMDGSLTGATIKLKGTNTGTIADVNGYYTITVPVDDTTLVFSYLGMKRLEVEIESRSVINLVLDPEAIHLDDITIGYNIKRTPRSTASYTLVLDGEKVNTIHQTNINDALAGKISGIQDLVGQG